MTVYDLLTSGHMVWLVYDAFYSNGEEDQEAYEAMLRQGIKMNFQDFFERSIFGGFSDKAKSEENTYKKGESTKDITKRWAERHRVKVGGDV